MAFITYKNEISHANGDHPLLKMKLLKSATKIGTEVQFKPLHNRFHHPLLAGLIEVKELRKVFDTKYIYFYNQKKPPRERFVSAGKNRTNNWN